MKRRDFMRAGVLGAAALIFDSVPLPNRAWVQSRQRLLPNIVLIMADDMGYSDLGCYGSEIRTPVLDSLASNGLRFTQFYNAARCCPTRASLMTGLYPHQAGLGHMVDNLGHDGYVGRLNERCVTIPEVLRSVGYQTFMAGKWHVTPSGYNNPQRSLHRDSWPCQRGFDHFYGTLAGAVSFYNPAALIRDNEFVPSNQEDYYYTDAINDTATEYIRQSDCERPLFLYVAHTAPHWPLHARQQEIDHYKPIYSAGWDAIRKTRYEQMIELGIIDGQWPLADRPRGIPAWTEVKDQEWEAARMAVHAAMVDIMDQGIGRIVEALKETGRFENTLFLFLSDNGGSDEVIRGTNARGRQFARGGTRPDVMPGEADTYASIGPAWANVANTPFRFYKKWAHEGGIATPLIAHWPNGIKALGELRHGIGYITDIMATCLDISEAIYPDERNGTAILPCEGSSLVPAFSGAVQPRSIFFEHQGNRAVRTAKWKLVAGHRRPWELYDMEADRTEMKDLAAIKPEIVTKMRRLYSEWASRTHVLPWPVK